LSFTTLGYSLPDLIVSGQAGPRASWGGTLNVTAYLQNIGASSTTEPVSQLPPTELGAAGSLYNSTSQADAPDSTIEVLLTPTKSAKGAIELGTFEAPALSQNNLEQVPATFTLPIQPAGFPGTHGTFYIRFLANSTDAFEESNFANNVSAPIAVHLTRSPLPQLRVIGLSVPSTLQPGDTIYPQINIENQGTANSGPVTVDLVASVTKSFTLGSSIVASYTVPNVAPVSESPTGGNYQTINDQNLTALGNVYTLSGAAVTLPTSPGTYYLGVVIDPDHKLEQLSLPKNALQAIHVVGPPQKILTSSGIISSGNTGQFPTAPTGNAVGIS
jgi:hypothetical protein